jgi:hypothetical protein
VRSSILYCSLIFFSFTVASAQFFSFGRNKVQYTDFDWHILSTEHFDIYYYPEMKDLVGRGAFLAEESYGVLAQRFNHNVLNRIPLILYSSHLHFEQSNTIPDFIPEGVGGFTEFLKGRVVIPYDGSMWDFRHVIRHELVHVFMYSKLNRVLADHHLSQDRLPPLWFVEGLAEYWSTDWDIQAEMVLRDATLSGYLAPLSEMDRIFGSFLMYKEGQNLLQFFSRRFGEEKILLLMENFWKSASFDELFKLTIDRSYAEFDREWIYALKKQYYPLLDSADVPSAVSHPLATEGFNSKPVFYRHENRKEIYFIGNRTGYTSIYRLLLDSLGAKPEIIIEGEKTNEFESFHLFQSKLDISKDGVLAFVTKSGENDALHLYDVEHRRLITSLHFNDLIVIGSPSWSPDGKQIVFTAVDKSGSSDLYIWIVSRSKLLRLTNDIYDDHDPVWSPRGDMILFTSDRTPYGEHGVHNLFLYTIATHDITYLTYGNESNFSPAWCGDGSSILFTSDAGGARNVWMLKLDSTRSRAREMRKLTRFMTAAFDPVWADSAMVFVAFENFSFQIRSLDNVRSIYDSSRVVQSINILPLFPPWTPPTIAGNSEVKSHRYAGEYSIDIAESEISTDPVFGTNGGAFLSLSDLLGNEQYYLMIYNTAQSSDELVSSFDIAISRVSLQQRANYAYGIYRFSGRRYDLTDPDEYYFEKVFGGYFTLNYPLSKFQRISISTSLSSSMKDASNLTFSNSGESNYDFSQRALLLSNSISFTHDNSLWESSGPIDGRRFSVALAYTTDIQSSIANYYSLIFDYRQYFRLASRSAYAIRLWLFYNGGEEARRFFMGGSWDLRGYDRFSIRGKKLWLISNELRFPFIDQFALRFPIGGVTLVGLRGAIFMDAGSAWDDVYTETLGSVGAGLRLNLAGAFVLRYDFGKRIESNFTKLQSDLFSDFFFGWDF